MQRLVLLHFSFLLITSALCQWQGKPFCLWEDQNAGAYYFCRHDASTGILNQISIVPGLDHYVLGNTSALSQEVNQYHFIGIDGANTRLYTVETSLGGLMANPIITDNIIGIESNCSDTSLYALREDGNNYDLVKIEALTGTITSIGAIQNVDGYVSETMVLAQGHGLYTFVALWGGTFHLRSYNIYDASLVYDHPFPDNLVGFEYNCSDSTIYALWEDAQQYKLERVHMYNGTHSTVAVINGVTPGYVAESSSIYENGYYTYRGFDANNNFALITVLVQNGSINYSTPTGDNAFGCEENMCCFGPPPLSIGDLNKDLSFELFPNPATQVLHIRCEEPITEYRVFDLLGKMVMHSSPGYKNTDLQIDVNDLNSGAYKIVLKSSTGYSTASFTVD